MSDEALIAELERQRESARQCFAYYDAIREGRGVLQERPKPDFSEITTSLIAVLKAHPVFGPGRRMFFAHKQLNLHPFWAVGGLLRVTVVSDAPSAVAWLHRLLEVDRADLRMVAVVHGLEVQDTVSLSNGVRLLPLAAAPDSPSLRSLARQYNTPSFGMEFAWMLPPTIAVLDMGTLAASTDHTRGQAAHDSALGALLDAARAFTLADHGAPVVGTSWTDFVDPELTVAEPGQMWAGASFEGSLSRAYPLKVDGEGLAWAERYLQMDGQLRRSMDVALDRLNLARRRRSPGDQAVDSGICLEALLSDESSTQELTYKLRLRAALLLGTTLLEREEISRAVRDLYSLHSRVVHGGVRRPKDTLRDTQCASRGLEICTQAVRAIVQRNARPDFAKWELTGGPPESDGT
jgi:hypothetical protein